MSLNDPYDPGNIFARIIRGEADAAKVCEDQHVLAFMDAFPQSVGHVLVVPRDGAARNLFDVGPDALAGLILAVQRISRAVVEALHPDGLSLMQFNGTAGGQTVFHLHFHIIPRWTEHALKPHVHGTAADPSELRALAARIAAALN